MVIDHTEITNTGISSTIHVGPISLMRVPLQSSSCDQIQWENGRSQNVSELTTCVIQTSLFFRTFIGHRHKFFLKCPKK